MGLLQCPGCFLLLISTPAVMATAIPVESMVLTVLLVLRAPAQPCADRVEVPMATAVTI